jgi:hypothetical protein
MYDIQRSDERIPFKTRCILEINGAKCTCLVDNISTAGALVEACSEPLTVNQGDVGTLKVLLLSPIHYQCSVVRVQGSQLALQFIY